MDPMMIISTVLVTIDLAKDFRACGWKLSGLDKTYPSKNILQEMISHQDIAKILCKIFAGILQEST